MEAYNMLRCVTLLGMLVLSLAAAAAPDAAAPNPEEFIYGSQKTQTLTCAKKCAVGCAMELFKPTKFAACVGLCMTACKIDDPKPKPPATAYVQNAVDADAKPSPGSTQPTTDTTHGCTRACVSSMSKVMTTNAKLTAPQGAAPPQPAANDLQKYAEGYTDACFLSCSKNNKVF